MGYFTDLINKNTTTKKTNSQIVIPTYAKPNLNTDLKISAPTGKELTLEQLPEKQRTEYEAIIREQNLQGKKGENFLQVIARAFPRAVQSVALDYMNPQGDSQYIPKTNFEKFLFGETPVKSLSKQYEEGKKSGLPAPIVATAVFGGAILDLTPFGGSRKKLSEQIAKTITDEAAETLLRKAGVADDLIKVYAPQVVKAKNVKQAEAIITRLDDLAKTTTKTTEAISPLAQEAPLLQQARKFVAEGKSAEEFVKNYDGGLILDRKKVNNWIAGGPDNTVPVSEILGLEGKKFMKEMNLPDIPVRVQEAGEDTIGHYAQIEWRGGNKLKDARINIEISPTEEFGVESLGVMEKNLLHELAHAKQITLNRLGRKKIQGEISEQAAEKHANYILSKVKSQLTDIYNQATKTAPDAQKGVRGALEAVEGIKPQITPENTINKLIKAIDDAIPLRADQKALYQQEMAKRTARVAQAGKVGGEKGFFTQLKQLKGELPKKSFEEIRKQFSQEEANLLFDAIEKAKTLLPLEKVGTKHGLSKLFQGIVPTTGELNNLKEVFPKELIDALLARRSLFEKITEVGGNILNIPRTVMASVDLSAPLRQGVFMISRPKQFSSAFKDMFKYAFSEKAYQGLAQSIKARPTYLKMKQGKLALTEIGGQLSKSEEAFMGSLVEKVPVFGSLVRASNRAYTGFLNKLRADIFDDILKKATIAGKDVNDDLLKSLGDFINAGTGRGKFGLKETGILPKGLEKIAPVLNATFFSPRLMASRLNLLNPYFYAQLNPIVRKEALKTLFADAGIFASIYGLWKLNGGDVGTDPRSADFGKLKIDNTRYDILGGFQQPIKLASQLITGEVVSTTTGRTITLGEGYKPLSQQEIVQRYFENKTSPIASFIIGLLKQQTATGEDFDVPTEVINRFIPMVVQDMYDISQEKGAEGLLYGLPAIFGVGVQTYGKQELVSGKSKIGEETIQIRPVQELAEKIRELVFGQLPIGSSKSFSVEAYFDQLSDLPREEARDIFDKIAEGNPELAKKLYDVVKEREKGITVKDKDLKSKGVASGDRALAIKKELDKLKTKEEKAQLWEEYVKKGIITKDVSEQLIKLLN